MKRIEELKVNDTIYMYGVGNLPRSNDFIIYKKLKIVRVNKSYNTIIGEEIIDSEKFEPIRHILKSNEGVVYRNVMWLSEDNKELAKKTLINFFTRKIEIANNEINNFKGRINLINEYFKGE